MYFAFSSALQQSLTRNAPSTRGIAGKRYLSCILTEYINIVLITKVPITKYLFVIFFFLAKSEYTMDTITKDTMAIVPKWLYVIDKNVFTQNKVSTINKWKMRYKTAGIVKK